MPTQQEIETWQKVLGQLAGVAGALVSMKFVKGPLIERLGMAFGGVAISYYCAPWIATKLPIPEVVCGFLVGLFGMSILSRIWEWMQTTTVIQDFLDAWLRRGKPRDRE